jgi:hypothetical protein
MTLQIMTDNGPVEEALYDGYGVAERLLEGVMFRIRIENDDVVCLGHRKMDDGYMKKFNKKQLDDWHQQIIANVKQTHGDTLECDGTDAWIEGLQVTPPVARPIQVIKGASFLDRLKNSG